MKKYRHTESESQKWQDGPSRSRQRVRAVQRKHLNTRLLAEQAYDEWMADINYQADQNKAS